MHLLSKVVLHRWILLLLPPYFQKTGQIKVIIVVEKPRLRAAGTRDDVYINARVDGSIVLYTFRAGNERV